MNIRRYIDMAVRRELRRYSDDLMYYSKEGDRLANVGWNKLLRAMKIISRSTGIELPSDWRRNSTEFLSEANRVKKDPFIRAAMELDWALRPVGPYSGNPSREIFEDLKYAIKKLHV